MTTKFIQRRSTDHNVSNKQYYVLLFLMLQLNIYKTLIFSPFSEENAECSVIFDYFSSYFCADPGVRIEHLILNKKVNWNILEKFESGSGPKLLGFCRLEIHKE
jgi:hypothetical protein